jgi:GTP-binding protein
LAGLPRILALSKADLVDRDTAERARAEWQEHVGPDAPVILTSAATGEGLDALARELFHRLPPAPPAERDGAAVAEFRVFRPGAARDFTVERIGDGEFRVAGESVDRLIARHDISNPDALEYVEQRLESLGVRRALEAAGFEPGDDVEIGGVVFELE